MFFGKKENIKMLVSIFHGFKDKMYLPIGKSAVLHSTFKAIIVLAQAPGYAEYFMTFGSLGI
jgi:hypothetical protein